MALFKRRLPTSTSSTDRADVPADVAELARSRNLQPIEGSPFDGGVTRNLWRLNFALYGHREPIGVGSAEIAAPRHSSYHESYAGTIDGRRVVVTNHQTNIAQLRAYDFESVAVCAVELGTIAPIALVQPRALPFIGHSLRATATGDQAFDDRFVTVLMPTVSPQALTDDVRHRMMAHDDWAFLGDDDWLLCASKGRYATADAISRRIDEVIGIVHTFRVDRAQRHRPLRRRPRRPDREDLDHRRRTHVPRTVEPRRP